MGEILSGKMLKVIVSIITAVASQVGECRLLTN